MKGNFYFHASVTCFRQCRKYTRRRREYTRHCRKDMRHCRKQIALASNCRLKKRDINSHTEDNECKFPENYNLIKKQATKQKYPFILSNFTDSNILEVLSP